MSAAVLRKAETTGGNVIEGEFAFTDQDFTRIAALLRVDSGIHLPDSKGALVYSRLAKRLRMLGLESFSDYCTLVEGHDGAEERRGMLSALTTNLTRFFREPHHFEHFRERTVPALLAEARAGGRIRFWSAGCSSGEEPYSMGLALLSVMPDAAELDVRILATDIDPVIVSRAREGVYSDEAISAVPPDMRRNGFQRADGGQWSVAEGVRRLIVFNELNLMGAWPMKSRFHSIFCRNVAIYFDEPTQERLWGRFAEVLTQGGRLYIGHSERVGSPRFETDGLTTYRLRGG